MKSRRKILFKVNGELVVEESRNLFDNEVDEMKWIIAKECSCHYDEISVDFIDLPYDLSEIDVTFEGMVNWKDPEFKIITGVALSLELGSDEHLDAINNGTLADYLIFI